MGKRVDVKSYDGKGGGDVETVMGKGAGGGVNGRCRSFFCITVASVRVPSMAGLLYKKLQTSKFLQNISFKYCF